MAENVENEATVEEPPAELEGQIILRLPNHVASHLKELLKAPTHDLHKRFRIDVEPPDMREAVVKLDNWIIPGKIYDLPCLTECQKTLDKKMFYKVADISQIIVCGEEQAVEENEKPYLYHEYLDKEGRDKRYLYPHGLTHSLKNVRKRRFRKTLRNKCSETPFIEKEVLRLLKTDSEAIRHRFELIDVNDKPKGTDDKQNDVKLNEITMNQSLGEFDIFGAILSSSEESGEDDDKTSSSLQKSENEYFDTEKENGEGSELCEDDRKIREDEICNPQATVESEAAGANLGEILKGEKTESEKDELYLRLQELEQVISNLRAQKRIHEMEMMSLTNLALKQKFQLSVDCLKTKEVEAQNEYDEIANSLLS